MAEPTLKENDTLKNLTERLESAREELREAGHKLGMAARGVITRISENGNGLLNDLVKTGEKLDKERQKAQKKTAKTKAAEKPALENAFSRAAGYLGLPTRDEVAALNKKLDSLSRKVRKMEKELASA